MKWVKGLCAFLTACAVLLGGIAGWRLWGRFRSMQAVTATEASVLSAPSFVASDASAVSSEPAVSALSSETASGKESAASVVSSKASSVPAAKNSSAASSKASSSAVSQPKPVKKKDTNETQIVTYTKRPTYASVQKEIKGLAKAYPDLISVESIGTSVQDRELTMMKVGKGVAKACIVGGIHARESVSISYVMRCVEEFCAAYESESGMFGGYDMKNLLNSYTLYIVPLSNPDGLEIISGRDTPDVTVTYRLDKTTGKLMTLSDYKANANGVNLNRNFPLLWDRVDTKCPTPDPSSYKGTAAASEPETQALMALCEANDFMWMVSVHVRGDCVYWSDTENPSVGLSETMANQLKERFGFYKCKTSDDVNGFGGGFENWFRAQYKRPGFCLELMPLDIKVTPLDNTNHQYFSESVRWNVTKGVFPILMIYGYID